jgi:diadenosine tetraphosphate (Ap4A) HIT family hydrolase
MADNWTLWEDARFSVTTTANPHLQPEEGCHLLVLPKDPPPHAWADPTLTAACFELAARVSQVLVNLGLVDWVNLQANGNWGLLPGAELHLHVHIYGRKRSGKTWAQPVDLPRAPGQFGFAPLSEVDRARLAAALTEALGTPTKGT